MNISDGDLKLPNLIAEKYIKVLWRLAVENGIENQVSRDISVINSFVDSADKCLLKKMSILKDFSFEIIDVISRKYQFSQFTVNMLMLMIKNGRMGLLKDVCSCYQNLVYEASGRSRFYVTLSENYNKSDMDEISACIKSRFSQNAECIFINGNERNRNFYGITIQYGDKFLDYSSESVVRRLVDEMRG